MKNSTIGKISSQKSGFPRSKFNLSHDVNTTCAWSDVQPLMVRAMIADSKATCGIESLIRLAPMVAPTFGDARFKTYHEFVAMSDLIRNFDALMSQTRVNRGSASFTPTWVPSMFLFDLSCLALIGSRCTVYYNGDGAKFDSTHSWLSYASPSSMQTVLNDFASDVAASTGASILNYVFNGAFPASSPFYGANDCWQFNPLALAPERFINLWSHTARNVYIPVGRGRQTPSSSVGAAFGLGDAYTYGQDVDINNADVLVFREYNGHGYAFAFRLSDFGKRIRKALLGAGYQLNFDTDECVSLMPLFALHKAWYELFGLQLFENYEDTYANKILQRYDNENVDKYSFAQTQLNYLDDLFGFAVELGSLWYTEKSDFVNAHTANITSNVKNPAINTFIDVYGASDGKQVASQNLYGPLDNLGVQETDVGKNGHIRTITQNHGQLDSELLKRLYKWTNRNSIVGQRVRDLLVQQGLSDYVDECEPRFIGYDDTHIQISDVVSNSDTFEAANSSTPEHGAILGEYGGRGLQYVDSKQFTFEAKEYGFWVCLAVVVPEAGYCQALDGNVLCCNKTDFYQPEFDGLGMEANPKLLVCADSPVANPAIGMGNDLRSTFGFAPRYSRLKVAPNVINGDFSLRSTRQDYEPYTLDRLFEINGKNSTSVDSSGTRSVLIHEKFDVADFPIAGNIWRYIGRYPFLTNFNRIFANVGQLGKISEDEVTKVDYSHELTNCQSDNFMVHNTVHMDYWAPMLPIEDSFETLEDGNNGRANSSIEKA